MVLTQHFTFTIPSNPSIHSRPGLSLGPLTLGFSPQTHLTHDEFVEERSGPVVFENGRVTHRMAIESWEKWWKHKHDFVVVLEFWTHPWCFYIVFTVIVWIKLMEYGMNWRIWDVFCFHGMKAVLKPPAHYDSVGLRPWAPPGALGTLPASSCRSCSACWRNWTKTLWPKMLRWGRRGIPRGIPRWETHVFFWWIFRRFCKHAGLQPRKLMKCIFSISW